MKDTETLNTYDRACLGCIDDLYRAAYLVFAESEAAEKLVTKVCTAGVHRYDTMTDHVEIRRRLVVDLYHICRRRLRFCTPSCSLVALGRLKKTERLLAVMWYVSEMPLSEFCEAAGISEAEYHEVLSKMAGS